MSAPEAFPYHYLARHTLSVIVPVFNEGEQITANLKLLHEEVAKHFRRYEIIVVSDGSTDGTNDRIREYPDPHLQLIELPSNQGKGAAIREGFRKAEGDFILFIDGGMEIHPKEIKIFLGLMFLYDADIVVGSKRHPQSDVYYPWYRRLLSWFFQVLVRILFKINVTDTQVGIKMFRRKVVTAVLPLMKTNSYGFDLELLGLAARAGYRNILEAPVRLDYFLKNRRSTLRDLGHTLKVGSALLGDTIRLWLSLRRRQ